MRLHGHWRSTASYRVRIALNYKDVAYQNLEYDLRTGTNRSDACLALNAQGLVPAIEVNGGVISQSSAIIEWLEEVYPTPALLPENPLSRAIVRSMVGLITSDIHPMDNLRVLNTLKESFSADHEWIESWTARWIGDGFSSLEPLLAKHGGKFAFGDSPTLADCFIVPQVYSAARFGIDLGPYRKIRAVAEIAGTLPAFAEAHPNKQPDADRP